MKTEIYERLMHLRRKYGPKEFGKICQKLLAIAYRMGGYTHIVERGVQGVDVDAASKNDEKYSVEVKTTVTPSVNFGQKDFDGLNKRKEDGYQPVLAVLRLNILSDWIFAKADSINVGRMYIDLLQPYRIVKLEEFIRPLFEKAVEEHFKGILLEGQSYLDTVLRLRGVELNKSNSE